MKKVFWIVLAMSVVILVSGCVVERTVIGGKNVTVTEEDLENKANYFNGGIYYIYVMPPESKVLPILVSTRDLDTNKGLSDAESKVLPILVSTRDLDTKTIFEDLIDSNADIKEGWYKPGASSCRVPGSGLVQPAVVEPVLIIRLGSEPQKILDNFSRIDAPNIGWCAYRVLHYIFEE